jgi:hypothetical protein
MEKPKKGGIAFFDLEACDLDSYFGVLLCGGILPLQGKPKVIWEGRKYDDDGKLAVAIRNELEKYDWLIGYNSLHYDLPLLNARLARIGERKLAPRLHTDLYRLCKDTFISDRKNQRCSLKKICDFLGLKGAGGETKGHVDFLKWLKVKMNPHAKKEFNEILSHCKDDIMVLPPLWDIIKDRVKQVRKI